ncbi:MAG: replicative DNA helicase, partial [candidate division WOR-3 bacterium]
EESFYAPAHRKIFRAITSLHQANITPDLVALANELKRVKELDGVGGMSYLSSLFENALTVASVEQHARIILDKSVKRRLISAASSIIQENIDDVQPAATLVDHAQNLILQIKERGIRKDVVSLRSVLTKVVEDAENQRRHRRQITGVETGYYKLDELTSGFQPGDFIVIAGRPSMGKTALALNIATHAAVQNRVNVLIFSLEMSTTALVQRLLCSEAKVNLKALKGGYLSNRDWTNLVTAAGILAEAPIYIDDTGAISILELKAKSRRLKAEVDIGMIIIDYLQLIKGYEDIRKPVTPLQEITEISRELKALAKELNIPVVTLSQLSRSPERREDKRPILADLRESGAIEQDADVVIFIYRDEVYGRTPENENLAEINVAKQRNGPTDKFELTFLSEYTRFENLSPREEVPVEFEGENEPY